MKEIMSWVWDGVDINRYIKPFKDVFEGQYYDDIFLPARVFNDSNKCKDFIPFICDTIQERLHNTCKMRLVTVKKYFQLNTRVEK